MSKGNEGVARMTRPCPFCNRTIFNGEPIARTRMGWVHSDCRLGVHRQLRDLKRMDAEFGGAVGARDEAR